MIYKGTARYTIIPTGWVNKDYKLHDMGIITRSIYGCKSFKEAQEKFDNFIEGLQKSYKDDYISVQITDIHLDE
jgi:hypothetical protein